MSDIHVVPRRDLLEHREIRQCWCRPSIQEWGGHCDTVVVHHAADGREYFEAAEANRSVRYPEVKQ